MHFHVCAVGGVFEEVAGEGDTDADELARVQADSPGVILHSVTGVNMNAVALVQAGLRRRILRKICAQSVAQWGNKCCCRNSLEVIKIEFNQLYSFSPGGPHHPGLRLSIKACTPFSA